MKKKAEKSEKNVPQEESSCGGKGKKYREIMKIKECFCSEFDPVNIVNSLAFSSKKPFKVSFNEGLSVKWNNKLISEENDKKPEAKKEGNKEPKTKKEPKKESKKEKKLTPRDKKQKKEFVEKMKGKMGGLRKKYGKRAEGVMHAIATKQAKKKS